MDLGRINLNTLHTFFTVAGMGGVSRAAESLSLTRSAVSQSIARLEVQLGVRLFHRVGRNLVLTREGRRLHVAYDRYRRGLSEVLAELGDELAVGGAPVRGTIRLGMYVGFSHSKLTGAVSRFLARYPETSIKMVFASARELERMLERNAVDFAFSIHPPSAKAPLRGTPLLREELVLVASPGMAPAVGTPEAVADLPVIDYYESRPLISIWCRHHFGARAPVPRVRAYAATSDAVLALALDGAGAGVIPLRQAEPHLRAGRLALVDPGGEPLADHLWLNELEDSSRRVAHRLFRESIVETFA